MNEAKCLLVEACLGFDLNEKVLANERVALA